jgi:hypothetical protein
MESRVRVSNKREHVRMPALARARVLLSRARWIDCVVRDLSPGGACLELLDPAQLPERFEIALDGDPLNRSCRIVWRQIWRVGVAFEC